jgi:hypothetical protein
MQHQISTVKSIEDYAESYMRNIKLCHPEFTKNEGEYHQTLILIRKMMTNFHNPRIETELQDLNENYDKCLLRLASVDPISAFRLKGKQNFISESNGSNCASETINANENK